MSKSLFSELWYRVANLAPRLRSHVQIHRHHYRDQLWYVLEDKIAGRYHRFSPSAYYVIAQMDGVKTLQQIWEQALANLGEEAPSQDECIQLVGQLHGSDVLVCDTTPDSLEIFERFKRTRKQKIMQRWLSPLSIRIPLYDPERVLAKFEGVVKPLFSWWGFFAWLVLVCFALVQAGIHWPELSENVSDTVLTPANLFLIWLLFPFVKALHEFGHGFATKVWGGEVHEMGIMFLIFMPVPYVDASAASKFKERRKRMIVGFAGVMVEVAVAALCLFIWINVEPGLVKKITYNIMLIAGVSTVFFNLNPLLRFDGYYVFADFLEMPNLFNRANHYTSYLTQRYLFRVKHLESPPANKREAAWLLGYSILSYVYRTIIMLTIALFIAGKYFFFGVILALWTVGNLVVMPLFKGLKFLFVSPSIQRQRKQTLTIAGGIAAVVVGLVVFFPAPLWTTAKGVVWFPDEAIVRSDSNCFITKVNVEPGTLVQPGQLLFTCESPSLVADFKVAKAKLKEIQVRYRLEINTNALATELVKDKLKAAEAELSRIQRRVDDLQIKSKSEGVLHVPLAQDLPGRFIHKGEEVAYVVPQKPATVRAVVTQSKIGLVRERTQAVQVYAIDDFGQPVQADVIREIPGAANQLPSAALGSHGGGDIAIDPRKGDNVTSMQPIFQLDVGLRSELRTNVYNRKVYVRFDHGTEPLIVQWSRNVRQLFLGRFGV